MMDPRTATLFAGTANPQLARDAQHLAELRDAESQSRSAVRSTAERVTAFFGRHEAPASASCDCAD